MPQTLDRPPAQRRLRPLCAPGYLGRKRGEIVRTRTTVLQAHTHQWLGTFGNAGNGEYRAELRRAVTAIERYVQAHHLKAAYAILRLDGQYGTGAVLSDLADLAYVTRGQDYHLLDQAGGTDSPAPAPRPVLHASRKRDSPHPLRLSGGALGDVGEGGPAPRRRASGS